MLYKLFGKRLFGPPPRLEVGKPPSLVYALRAYPAALKPPTRFQRWQQHYLAPLLGEARQEQLATVTTSANQRTISPAEQEERQRLALSLVATGLGIGGALGSPLLALLSMATFIYASGRAYRLAYQSLWGKRKADVSVLLALTNTVLILTDHYIVGNIGNTFFALSRLLVFKVQNDAKNSFVEVFQQQRRFVWVRLEQGEIEIPFTALQQGQVVVVGAGETLPVDGVIVEGAASIDQHILTGEFQAVEKGAGEQVFASTTVLTGKIYVVVEKTGADTTVAQIGALLNRTVDHKADLQLRAEQMADQTVVPMIMAGFVSLPLLGPLGAAAVVNAHFKHKMSILGPVGMLNYLHIASQQGILIKDGRTFDLMETIDTVVFDKTGTLTYAQPHVGRIHLLNGHGEDAVLAYAAAAEQKQGHPIALAIRAAAQQRQLVLPAVDDAVYKVGYGLTVRIDDTLVRVGSARFLVSEGLLLPDPVIQLQEEAHQEGYSLVMVAFNHEVVSCLELHPIVRPEAKAVISSLRAQGVTSLYIISGDHEAPTRRLAAELGIDHYFAEVLPQDKAAIIDQLQAEGKRICFVGDGINDSIALKKAQVSVSLRGASAVAIDTAQVILMDESLTQLPKLLSMSKSFEQNLKVTYALQWAPTCLCIGGIFFLGWGFGASVICNQLGLLGGLYNAMLPLQQWRQAANEQEHRYDVEGEKS